MVTKYNAQRRELEIAADQAMVEQLTIIAQLSSGILLTYADSDGQIPTDKNTRDQIVDQIWEDVLKPYFIGPGSEPFIGSQPNSPYAQHIYDGILGVMTITAEEQIDIIDDATTNDPALRAWLTAPNPNIPIVLNEMLISEQIPGNPVYDPFHLFVYGDSPYTLSDRVWNTSIDVRDNIDQMLAYEIPRGTSAVDIADRLATYLTPGAAPVTTNTPYGVEGSYSARRLSRTEITAAAGRSTINASVLNPYVIGDQWVLSGSHPEPDPCDDNANGGPNGDGIYKPENFPPYPNHPHELCTIVPVVTDNPAAITASLRTQMDSYLTGDTSPATQEISALQGAFNRDFLIAALLFGWFIRHERQSN